MAVATLVTVAGIAVTANSASKDRKAVSAANKTVAAQRDASLKFIEKS